MLVPWELLSHLSPVGSLGDHSTSGSRESLESGAIYGASLGFCGRARSLLRTRKQVFS